MRAPLLVLALALVACHGSDPGASTAEAVEDAGDGAASEILEDATHDVDAQTADANASGFVPIFTGGGTIEDLATGEIVTLPMERRIHVVLLAEGYREEDLASGAFDRDAQAWVDEVLSVEPYATFRDALVVWKLPIASAEHATHTSPQAAKTAFHVPIDPDGGSIDTVPTKGETAEAVWATLADFPYPPKEFYRGSGQLVFSAKRLVLHVLVFDPERGASGYAGVSTNLRSPSDPNHWVAAAVSRTMSHEFGHAFGRLRDEYVRDSVGTDNALTDRSLNLSNVVADPSCATVPWKHLLDGAPGNPASGLVGAFGTKQSWHPELRCLMNGFSNAAVFGGDGNLRSKSLCNWCREIVAFRFFERVGILPDEETSWATWVESYRTAYRAKVPFHVPEKVPQENSEGTPIYQACKP